MRPSTLLIIIAAVAGVFAARPAAAQCPDYSLNGQSGTYTSDGLYTAVRHTLTAGGDVDLATCEDIPGTGWVTREPDFTFRFSGNGAARRMLRFRTDARCDTVLLVNTPSAGWRYDDDGGSGLNAQLDIAAAPDGIYDIWVGTSDSANCRATLVSETFNAGGGKRSR